MVQKATINRGDVIQIHNWYGVVLETHFDDSGELSVIRVQTARNIFRGYGPEYIDVRLDPETIKPATRAELEQEIATHRRLLEGAVGRLLAESSQREAAPSSD
jgi:hypothetical protein